MQVPFTKLYKDKSDPDSFCFSFACAICGKVWESERKPFSHEGFDLPLSQNLRALVWENEHRTAFEQVNAEAMFHFSRCPRCGKWVCDECFYVAHAEQTDFCIECGAKDAQTGDAVTAHAINDDVGHHAGYLQCVLY